MPAPSQRQSNPLPDPLQVMTIEELAIYLKIAKSTLYKLAQEGKVPGKKVGKHWRFNRQAIDDWISVSSGKARSNNEPTP